MEIVTLFWVICAIAGAVIGGKKNAPIAGFLCGLIAGPIGVLVALCSKGNMKRCLECRELVDDRATRCPHCRQEIARR